MMERMAAVLTVLLFIAIGWWAWLPRQGPGFRASKRSMCANNMKWLGLALHQYDIDHGTLPPAFIPGDVGKPDGIGIHDRGFNAIMADGAAMFLPHTMTQSDFDSLVTRSGNEGHVELHSHPLPPKQ
jgi:hypothetical protein